MSLPPLIPLIACYAFIAWLLWKDSLEAPVGSKALWITGPWLFILGSRGVGSWLFALFGTGGKGSDLEGNPIDVIVLSSLILSSIAILNRRGFQWGAFLASNKTVLLIYLYFLASAIWADYSFVVIKRVIKDFGFVFLVLVIGTELNWSYAIRKVFLRVAYVIFPLSVVLIKWFPSIGRSQSAGGTSMMGGVTVHKNSLGEVLVVFGLILAWDLVEHLSSQRLRFTDSRVIRRVVLLAIGGWLVVTADSQTSTVCLMLGLFLFWFTGRLLKTRSPKLYFGLSLLAALSVYSLDATFQIKDHIIESLGRNVTLTGRTRIWEIVKDQQTSSLVGCGFMSFWDSQFGIQANQQIFEANTVAGASLNSAHNGYLDVYLDGGIIGVFLLLLMLAARGIGIMGRLFSGTNFGRMGFIFFCIALLYNTSESSFFRLDALWAMLLMAMISVPRHSAPGQEETVVP